MFHAKTQNSFILSATVALLVGDVRNEVDKSLGLNNTLDKDVIMANNNLQLFVWVLVWTGPYSSLKIKMLSHQWNLGVTLVSNLG